MTKRNLFLCTGLSALLLAAVAARAQEIPPPRPFPAAPEPSPAVPDPTAAPAPETIPPEFNDAPAPLPSSAGFGLEAESLPGELAEDIDQATSSLRLGPTAVSNVRFLMDGLGLDNWIGPAGIQTFGWVEGGYTRIVGRRWPALRRTPPEPLWE